MLLGQAEFSASTLHFTPQLSFKTCKRSIMSEDNHSCPLTSLWGLEWRLQTSSTLFQPEKTDLEKVEAARKLAADCFYRQECFSARADSINTLCAR